MKRRGVKGGRKITRPVGVRVFKIRMAEVSGVLNLRNSLIPVASHKNIKES